MNPVELPDWLVRLRREEVTDRVRADPRSGGSTLFGMDHSAAFEAICGGQADFDTPRGNCSADDLALLYAHLNQRGHLEELVEAFSQLLSGSKPVDPIVVDIGCGPFTGGLALIATLSGDPCFDYIGVDRAASGLILFHDADSCSFWCPFFHASTRSSGSLLQRNGRASAAL